MTNQLALDLIRRFEGCHLTAYPDPGTRVTAGLRRRRIAEGLLWNNGAKP